MSKTWAILTRAASTAVLRECGYEKEEAMSEQEALARTIQDNMRDKSGCFVGWQTCYAAAEAVLALRASGHGAGREAGTRECPDCGTRHWCAPLPAAPSPDDQPAGCESAARSARIAIDKV